MVNRSIDFQLRPGDFRFKHRDPFVQFADRKRIEILLGDLGQRIVRRPGLDVFEIHAA